MRALSHRVTALHSRKDFAVSAGLNRVISVRTSMVTHGRRYLLRFYEIAYADLTKNVRTFLPDGSRVMAFVRRSNYLTSSIIISLLGPISS